MLFDKEYKEFGKAASSDDSRPSLSYVKVINAEECRRIAVALPPGSNGAMLATNGFVLACVPVELEPDDVPGLLAADHVKVAAKLAKGAIPCRIGLDSENTVSFIDSSARPRVGFGDFSLKWPDVKGVIPRSRPGVLNKVVPLAFMAFNPALLADLVQALGFSFIKSRRDDVHIRMTQNGGRTDPFIVEPLKNAVTEYLTAPFGLLMPLDSRQAADSYYLPRDQGGALRSDLVDITWNFLPCAPEPEPEPEPVITVGYWGDTVPSNGHTAPVAPVVKPAPVYEPMTDEEKAAPVPVPAGNGQWPDPTVDTPSMGEVEYWVMDGVCEATDGCRVEPDGYCSHRHPSWLVRLGLI